MAKKEGGQEKKKGRPRSAGRQKAKREKYFTNTVRFAERKLRKILRNSGESEAQEWAKAREMGAVLERLLKEKEECVAKTATSAPAVSSETAPPKKAASLPPLTAPALAGNGIRSQLEATLGISARKAAELATLAPAPMPKTKPAKAKPAAPFKKKPTQRPPKVPTTKEALAGFLGK